MADDYAGDITTLGVLPLYTPVTGELETAGDQDWFRVELVAGTDYQFEIAGTLVSPYTLDRTLLTLYDSEGVTVEEGFQSSIRDSSGDILYSSGIRYTPVQSGTYFVAATVDQFTPLSQQTGTYRMFAIEWVPEVPGDSDDFGDGRATAEALPSGQTLYADIESSLNRDWYSVTLTAGHSYYVEMDHNALPSSPGNNSVVDLLDASGTLLKSSARLDADGVRAGLSFAADSDGTAFLIAAVRPPDDFRTYALTLRELPSLFFTASADWLSLPADVPTDLLDIRGGAGVDTMSFAGLTQGVEVNLATGLARAGGPGAFSLIMDSVEHVTGTSRSDTVWGAAGADRVRGLGGNDTFYGSAGADRLEGGAGRDTVDYGTATAGVSASLLRDLGWAGDAAGDRYDSIAGLIGSRFADSLWGDHGANRLDGGHGDDTITGNGGDDYILTGFGTDVIVFSGNQADYTIARAGFRTEVTDTLGRDGTDIIAHAELLRFADGDLIL